MRQTAQSMVPMWENKASKPLAVKTSGGGGVAIVGETPVLQTSPLEGPTES